MPNKRIRKKWAKLLAERKSHGYHGVSLIINGNIVGRITKWEPTKVQIDENIPTITTLKPEDFIKGTETYIIKHSINIEK